jgi:hypothetical protein
MAVEREQDTARTYVVRYPDGSSEFRMGRLALQVGDALMGRGDRWLVAEIAEYSHGTMTVLLRPRESEA